MASLLQLLVRLSEKAANLARSIRSEKALFELLVEEKTGDQKNKKFIHDFKTLADVLIQEMIRHGVSKQYPALTDYVFGEESNKFTNTLGENVTVAIQPTQPETCNLLTTVLGGNVQVAAILASIIHQEVAIETDPLLLTEVINLNIDSVGIWIDPIDGTSEYIKGGGTDTPTDGIHPAGLPIALVLIGVFDKNTGQSLMGIINQPFSKWHGEESRWTGQYIWGISYGDTNINSLEPCSGDTGNTKDTAVVMSRGDVPQFIDAMTTVTKGNIKYTGGAGYKIFCAIQLLVDAYVLSTASTFKWDTCGPHAILRSLGGGIVDLKKALQANKESSEGTFGASELQTFQLVYDKPDIGVSGDPGQKWANSGGIIAYRNPGTALTLLHGLNCHQVDL